MENVLVGLVGFMLGAALLAVWLWFYFNKQKMQLERENAKLMAESYASKRLVAEKNAEIDQKLEELNLQRNQLYQLHAERTRLHTELQHAQQKVQETETQLVQIQKQMRLEFEQLAQRIFEHNTQKLSHENESKLDVLLSPLKEKLTTFEQKVENAYQQEARERFLLKKELESLMQLNQQLSQEAHSLTQALKGDSKMQGNWGELILTKILENSGLREGEEFIVQSKDLKLTAENGQRQQPDVIIQLPDKRHLIIDAKVSLTAYERYISTESEIEKRNYLRKHIESIQQHVQNLSGKHYESLGGLFSPDFILLFMPLESAFSLAISSKPDLFHQAFEKKIVIVSPTTLLATLKTVSSIWKLEQQNRNAAEIARQGGLLYDKFVSFTEEVEKVGKNLRTATDSYDKAVHRLTTGRDSLLHRAEKLRELGVKVNKQVPNSLQGELEEVRAERIWEE